MHKRSIIPICTLKNKNKKKKKKKEKKSYTHFQPVHSSFSIYSFSSNAKVKCKFLHANALYVLVSHFRGFHILTLNIII